MKINGHMLHTNIAFHIPRRYHKVEKPTFKMAPMGDEFFMLMYKTSTDGYFTILL